MSYQARETGGSPVVLRWQLRCQGAKETPAARATVLPRQGWQSFEATFVVPPRDCLIQRLVLKRVQADNHSETWVDSVRMTRTAH